MKLLRLITIVLALGTLGTGLAATAAADGLAVDSQPPVVTILGKASPIRLTNNQLLIKVMATDNVGIQQVWFNTQQKGGPLTLNESTGFYEAIVNSAELHFPEDTLRVFAMDFSGNIGMDIAMVDNNINGS